MKLEYIYYNNQNLKYAIKCFFYFGLVLLILSTIIILYCTNTISKFDISMCICAITIPTVFFIILSYIIIRLNNNYKRKQFVKIKENGNHYKGTILTANIQTSNWRINGQFIKNTGEISVEVNNKVYAVKDIDYNDEFKLLEKSLEELSKHLDNNIKQFNDFIHQRQDSIDKNFDILKDTQMEIDIYVLDDKAIADLNSIKIK